MMSTDTFDQIRCVFPWTKWKRWKKVWKPPHISIPSSTIMPKCLLCGKLRINDPEWDWDHPECTPPSGAVDLRCLFATSSAVLKPEPPLKRRASELCWEWVHRVLTALVALDDAGHVAMEVVVLKKLLEFDVCLSSVVQQVLGTDPTCPDHQRWDTDEEACVVASFAQKVADNILVLPEGVDDSELCTGLTSAANAVLATAFLEPVAVPACLAEPRQQLRCGALAVRTALASVCSTDPLVVDAARHHASFQLLALNPSVERLLQVVNLWGRAALARVGDPDFASFQRFVRISWPWGSLVECKLFSGVIPDSAWDLWSVVPPRGEQLDKLGNLLSLVAACPMAVRLGFRDCAEHLYQDLSHMNAALWGKPHVAARSGHCFAFVKDWHNDLATWRRVATAIINGGASCVQELGTLTLALRHQSVLDVPYGDGDEAVVDALWAPLVAVLPLDRLLELYNTVKYRSCFLSMRIRARVLDLVVGRREVPETYNAFRCLHSIMAPIMHVNTCALPLGAPSVWVWPDTKVGVWRMCGKRGEKDGSPGAVEIDWASLGMGMVAFAACPIPTQTVWEDERAVRIAREVCRHALVCLSFDQLDETVLGLSRESLHPHRNSNLRRALLIELLSVYPRKACRALAPLTGMSASVRAPILRWSEVRATWIACVFIATRERSVKQTASGKGRSTRPARRLRRL